MRTFRLAISLILSASGAWAQHVDQIVRRIQELVPRESLSLGIETELRAASLLRESRPELAAAFLDNGERLLAAHPDVEPTKWIVSSLLTLEPERGEEAVLKPAKPGSFDSLLQYYFSSNRPDRGAAVLQKALRDDGPPVPYVATAIQKLIPLDPAAAADAYFTLKDSPKLASRYVAAVNRAPVVFSQGLAHAAAMNPEAARTVLARLLPLFDDEKLLGNVRLDASITTRIGGEEVRTRNARETVLFRLGALARAIDPELYKRNKKRFDARLQSVKTLDDALAIADARTESNGPQKPGFDFAKEPVEAVLAEWRKMEFRPRLYNATGALLGRADLSPAQKKPWWMK